VPDGYLARLAEYRRGLNRLYEQLTMLNGVTEDNEIIRDQSFANPTLIIPHRL